MALLLDTEPVSLGWKAKYWFLFYLVYHFEVISKIRNKKCDQNINCTKFETMLTKWSLKLGKN